MVDGNHAAALCFVLLSPIFIRAADLDICQAINRKIFLAQKGPASFLSVHSVIHLLPARRLIHIAFFDTAAYQHKISNDWRACFSCRISWQRILYPQKKYHIIIIHPAQRKTDMAQAIYHNFFFCLFCYCHSHVPDVL